MDRVAGRPRVHERGARDAYGRRRAVVAPFDRPRRASASLAPRWCQHLERGETPATERPPAVAATGASRWEDHVERACDHEATVPATADIVRARC
jgi:hypothetical protein